MDATLNRLANVRSRLSEDIEQFCTRAIEQLDATPYHRPEIQGESCAITLSDTVIDARVYTWRRKAHIRARIPVSRSGTPQLTSPDREHVLALNDLNGAPSEMADREAIPWSRAFAQTLRQSLPDAPTRANDGESLGRPLIVLGAPGGGKTTLTRHETVRRLTVLQHGLAGHTLLPEEGEPMLWTTCSELARTPAGRDPVAMIIQAAFDALGLPADCAAASVRVRAWLRERLQAGRCPVVLDSLDELTEKGRARFRTRAKSLAYLGAPVVLTCRLHDWHRWRDEGLWSRRTEVTLAPFNRREQRRYARRFFAEETRLSGRVETALASNAPLRRMCESPLLLFFTCLLHGETPAPAATMRRTELYEQVCHRIFAGRWRGQAEPPAWADGDRNEAGVSAWLAEISCGLFRAAPEAKEFSLAEWKRAALGTEALRAERTVHPRGRRDQDASLGRAGKLFDDLVGCGFFVPVGKRGSQPRYVFAHRSFLAFLAGRALGSRSRKVWLKEVLERLWFNPAWEDVLLFLAGHLGVDDGDALLDAVAAQREDVFLQGLRWRLRLAAEMQAVSGRQQNELGTFAVHILAGKLVQHLAQSAVGMLCRCLAPLSRVVGPLHELFLTALDPEHHFNNEHSRSYVISLLGGNLSDVSVLPALLRWLDPAREVDQSVRETILRKIGEIGDPSALPDLLPWLDPARQLDVELLIAVVEAIGEIGDPSALPDLLPWLDFERSKDEKLHIAVLQALTAIGAEFHVGPIFRYFQLSNIVADLLDAAEETFGEIVLAPNIAAMHFQLDPRHEVAHWFVRLMAVRAVSAIGDLSAQLTLLLWLDPAREVEARIREAVARALMAIGDASAVPALLPWVDPEREASDEMRVWVFRSLAVVGGPAVLPRLVPWLDLERAVSVEVRAAATMAIGLIADASALPFLRWCLDPEREVDPQVRFWAAVALGNIGDASAVPALLPWLETGREVDPQVRVAAIRAASTIGDGTIVGALNPLLTVKDEDDSVNEAAWEACFKIYWRMKNRRPFLFGENT